MKLTAAAIAKLTSDKPDHIEWDDDLPSFGVRLRNGRKTYVCQYRIGTQQRRESLGDVRKVRLDAARKVARQRFASVELGVDPKPRPAGPATGLTMGGVADRYLVARKDAVRPTTYAAAERHFRVHFGPLRELPFASISRAAVSARLQDIVAEHGRVAAARARAYLSALYGWALREGLYDGANVAAGTNNPGNNPPRDRVLSLDEVRAIWRTCTDDDFGIIVRLLFVTGQRRNEIADLRWSEVDFSKAEIALPKERVKNKHAHIVPLSPLALALLKSRPRQDGRDLIFGQGDRGFTTWTHAKAKLDAAVALPSWTLHDARRAIATGLAEIDVQPAVIEAVLNHQGGLKGGIAGTYNRAKLEPQKRRALDLWAAVIENRVPEEVVPLRA
jgi:integrase